MHNLSSTLRKQRQVSVEGIMVEVLEFRPIQDEVGTFPVQCLLLGNVQQMRFGSDSVAETTSRLENGIRLTTLFCKPKIPVKQENRS
jgi:hypothetical protein